MPRFYDPTTKQTTFVGSPKLNPDLVKGKTAVPEEITVEDYLKTPAGQQAITSQSLAPSPDPNFQTGTTRPPESISGLSADIPKIEPAPIEQKADVLSERLQAINESILGRGAFRRGKETEFGVSEAQQSLDDLSVRLRDLERREKAIPIQIQQEFAGRGATAGGVAPIEAGRLRENAIEALTVSALIDASSNRLTSAQRKVDRAVDEKYGPLLEEQAVKLANLDIILKSPAYSRAEKERAEKQKVIEETRKTQIQAEKDTKAEILKIANKYTEEAAKVGKFSSVVAEQIQKAKDIAEAQRIMGENLPAERVDLKTQVMEIGGRKVLVNTQTGETIRDLGVSTVSSGAVGITDATGKPIKLSAAQTDSLASFDTTTGGAQDALNLLNSGVKTGPLTGRALQLKKLFGRGDPKQLQLEQLIGKIKADFFKAISGAAVSEQEVNRLSKFLPDINDQENVIRSKLNTLIGEMSRSKNNLLKTLGASTQSLQRTQEEELRAAGYTEEQIREIINAK